MKFSLRQAGYFRPSGRKIAMALAFASLISGLSISPALAERNDRHDQGERHGDHNWRASRGHRGGYGYRPEYRYPYNRYPYNYEQPVYVPPPVYYEPPQSPGINLFFPLDFRR